MTKLLTTIVLMTTITSAFGQAPVMDFINIKAHCESLKSMYGDSSAKEQTVCEERNDEVFKADLDMNITVNRVDPEKEEIEQISTKLSESRLAKICKELESSKYSSDEDRVLTMDVEAAPKLDTKDKRRWRISFTFGPFLSYHKKMKMRLQNEATNTDLVIDGLEPIQRTGHHHYQFWSGDTRPGQFIDEPQNDFTLEISNGKWFAGLRYSHPKTLFQDNHDNPQINHHVNVKGIIGGIEANEDDVNLIKYIHTLSTSHGNTNIGAFGGRIFNLFGTEGKNNLELRVGVGAGVSIANGVSKYFYLDEDGIRKLEVTEHQGIKPYGFYATGESSLRYNFMKGKMNASINARGVYTRIDGPIGNLKATGNLYSGQVGVAIGYSPNLLKTKKEKAARKIAKIEKRKSKRDELRSELEELQAKQDLKDKEEKESELK